MTASHPVFKPVTLPDFQNGNDKIAQNSILLTCVHMHALAFKQIQVETLPEGIALPVRWIRISQALQFYPWKRAKLYELMKSGAIKSFAYREPGKRSRMRLIDKDSIDAYLDRQAAKAYAEQERARTKAIASQEEAA